MKLAKTANFITLTYDNEHVPLVQDKFTYMTLDKKDVLRFHKAIVTSQTRTLLSLKKKNKLSSLEYHHLKRAWKIKYYTATEYGGITYRPHIHTIMYNIHPDTFEKLTEGKIWDKGTIFNGSVNGASISYVAKYVVDKDIVLGSDKQVKPFSIMSKGLGENYLKSKSKWHKQQGDSHDDYRYYVMNQGFKQRLPRYYKDKIFTNLDKLIHAPKAEEESIEMYLREIERLSESHHDPAGYYEEIVLHKHNQIKVKSKKLMKL